LRPFALIAWMVIIAESIDLLEDMAGWNAETLLTVRSL
jgi:hypothetical protein